MKDLEFHEVGPPFTEAQLLALEKRVGFKLPDDVVTFLRRNNGGRPLYSEFFVPDLGEWIDFHEVKGIGASKGIEFWLDEYQSPIYEGGFPEHMLPIGKDTFGDWILVKSDGGVYYWDIDGYYSDGSTTDKYKVADSFSAFIDSLQRVVL